MKKLINKLIALILMFVGSILIIPVILLGVCEFLILIFGARLFIFGLNKWEA